jgi:hypothetical protein
MSEKPTELHILFDLPEGYRPVQVTNVWGGPTPAGNLEMNFFFDRSALPDEVTYGVGPSGGLGPELRRDPPRGTFVRHVACGVIMSLEHARAFSGWLAETLAKLEQARAAGAPLDMTLQ